MYERRKSKIKAACLAIIVASSTVLLLEGMDSIEIRSRRWWVKPWLKQEKGNINLINDFLSVDDLKSFKNYLRMNKETFLKLLKLVTPSIKKNWYTRDCISAKTKLIITLRYLATGESYRSLMYNYRVSESAISLFIPIVCRSIYEKLKSEYLKVPKTTAEWLNIAQEFQTQWNMPNVLGALDGKHIVIKAPNKEGSLYFNYKEQHSIVLLALVDANYNFLYINVGMNGRVSDGGIYWNCDLSRAVERNTLNFPEERALPGRQLKVPFVIVADSAFGLSRHIMKPYPFKGISKEQRIFNYRLSRARRVVENSFGILANRFRVLLTTIALQPEKAKEITLACCALHNFLKRESTSYGANIEEEVQNNEFKFLYGLSEQRSRRPDASALKIRDEFSDYFNTIGSVPWQNNL